MQKEIMINDIGLALCAVGYTTNKTAAAIADLEQNQADWTEAFSTACIDAALRQTGEYAGFCRGDLARWVAVLRSNVKEVAKYVVELVCRSLHMAFATDTLCDRLSDAPYIDDYAPLTPIDKLANQARTADIDTFFKPHKSMTAPLSSECQEVLLRAKRELCSLFTMLVEKMATLKSEATRKEARKSVEVAAWVKSLRSRKEEAKERVGEGLEKDLHQVMAQLDYTRREAVGFMVGSQEDLLADNPFYRLYEQAGEDERKFAVAVRRQSGNGMGEQLDQFIELMAKIEWLKASIREELAAPSLVLTSVQEQAFARAIARGYMSKRGDGTYEWRLSKVLLAYFLGRLFCGDYISTDNVADRKEWTSGGKDFPEGQLARLFDVGSVSNNRRTRLGKTLPEGWEKIEGVMEPLDLQSPRLQFERLL